MESELPPTILGAAGLTGRQQILRAPDLEKPIEWDEDGNPVYAVETQPSKAIPPNCLRKLVSPLRPDSLAMACNGCQGMQEDGSCLVDIVKRANELGVDWEFAVTVDEYGFSHWTYAGPSLDRPESQESTEGSEVQLATPMTFDDDGLFGHPV